MIKTKIYMKPGLRNDQKQIVLRHCQIIIKLN